MSEKIGIEKAFTKKFLNIYFHSIFRDFGLGADLTYEDENRKFQSTCPTSTTDNSFKPDFCREICTDLRCVEYREKTHNDLIKKVYECLKKNSSDYFERPIIQNDYDFYPSNLISFLEMFNETNHCWQDLNNLAFPIFDIYRKEVSAVLHVGGYPDKYITKQERPDLNE